MKNLQPLPGVKNDSNSIEVNSPVIGETTPSNAEPQNDFDELLEALESKVQSWQWDGTDVAGIASFAKSTGLSVEALVTDYFPNGWQDTVPPDFQQEVRSDEHSSSVENSEATLTRYLKVLAVDNSDRALTQTTIVDNYHDAENISFHVVPVEDLVEDFSQSGDKAPQKPSRGMGM